MTQPVRLQLSRRKGFNLQQHSRAVNGLPAINVARPSRWGNPWRVIQHQQSGRWRVDGPRLQIGGCWCGNREGAQLVAVDFFRQHCDEGGLPTLPPANHNLACFCGPGEPCHASVLLEISNRPTCEAVREAPHVR